MKASVETTSRPTPHVSQQVGQGFIAATVSVVGGVHIHPPVSPVPKLPGVDPKDIIPDRAGPSEEGSKAKLTSYLHWLVRTQSAVRINDIIKGVVGMDADPLQLGSVFVDVNVTLNIEEGLSLAEHLRRERDGAAAAKGSLGGHSRERQARSEEETQAQARNTRSVNVFEALGIHQRLVLIGDAGCGKSTVGQFLTLALARACLEDAELLTRLGETWTHGPLLPVPLVLREFAACLPANHARGCANDIWVYLRKHFADCGQDEGWMEAIRTTASGRGALFLLDGWDETHDSLRLAIGAEALADLIKNTGNRCRFLLTSRPYAWDSVLLAAEEKKGAELDRVAPQLTQRIRTAFKNLHATLPVAYEVGKLGTAQVQRFIEGWYRAVQAGERPWFTAKEANDKKADLEVAAAREEFQPVVSNPLLLTLTASLSATHLPDDRADLFNEIVELLLKRWTDRIGSSQSLREALGREIRHEDIRQKIEDCAFAAHQGHVGHVGLADIPEASLRTAIAGLLGGSEDQAKIVVEFVEKRTGLLLSRGLKAGLRQFSCPHRAFQEFLAGCHLAAKEAFTSTQTTAQPEEVPSALALAREHPGHWREVLCFAARQARPERGSLAAHTLVHGQSFGEWTKQNTPTEADWRCAAVAGKQLLEIGLDALRSTEVTRLRLDHVAGWLGALIESNSLGSVRERLDVSVDLARLGDPRNGVRLRNGLLDPFAFIPLPHGIFKLAETGKPVVIKKDFRVARYPVTVEQYATFVAAGGYGGPEISCPKPTWWSDAGWEWRNGRSDTGGWPDWLQNEYGRETFPILHPKDFDPVFQTPNHPRVGVGWYEATAFCAWLTEQLREKGEMGADDQISLPSEAQWEWAARWNGDTGVADDRRYPWGGRDEKELAERCNMAKTGLGHTSAVGLFPTGQAGCGAMDLSGNVWEWCENRYNEAERYRVLRGGSWLNDYPELLSCGSRLYDLPGNRGGRIGFRCVWVSGSAR